MALAVKTPVQTRGLHNPNQEAATEDESKITTCLLYTSKPKRTEKVAPKNDSKESNMALFEVGVYFWPKVCKNKQRAEGKTAKYTTTKMPGFHWAVEKSPPSKRKKARAERVPTVANCTKLRRKGSLPWAVTPK